MIVAFFLSAYCKGVDLESDDADQDETPSLLYPKSQWKQKTRMFDALSRKKKNKKLTISETQLDIAKELRVKEKEMWYNHTLQLHVTRRHHKGLHLLILL